jgi:prophage tail gpP-like protein
MRDSDTVYLVINGTEFSGFDGATIDMAIDHIADGFSLASPWNPDDPVHRKAFAPFEYQDVKLYIGTDLLLTGTLEKPDPSLSESDRTITLEGRSKTGVLADCSIDGDLEYSGLTLGVTTAKICKPFSISVIDQSGVGKIELARADYGQIAGDFINSLSSPRNVCLGSSYGGALILDAGSRFAKSSPVAELTEGKHPLTSITPSFDGTTRGSHFKVASQFAGQENIIGKATDPDIKVYRPMITTAGETDQNPSITATKMRGDSYAKSVNWSASISGWRRPDGGRWCERTIVSVFAPSAMIYRKSSLLIAQVTYTIDGSGRKTILRLVLPETYAGTPSGVPPWVY